MIGAAVKAATMETIPAVVGMMDIYLMDPLGVTVEAVNRLILLVLMVHHERGKRCTHRIQI